MKNNFSGKKTSGQVTGVVSFSPSRKWMQIILALLAGLGLFHWIAFAVRGSLVPSKLRKDIPPPVNIAWKNVDEHLAQEKARHRFGGEFPAVIVDTVTRNVQGHFSVYVEDLRTGVWWGINEATEFEAWSLLKVSTLVSVLKKAEREMLSLDHNIILTADELQVASPFIESIVGDVDGLSIKELAERMIKGSDDASAIALCKLLSFDEFQEGLRATDMPLATPPNKLPRVSPRQYANLLRSLYFSTYLDPVSSEVALSLLSNTVFNDLIRAGVPRGVAVAHKVGFNSGTGDSHDCGIVFLDNRPYIICVMSTGTSKEESDRVISTVSRQIYDFMESRTAMSLLFPKPARLSLFGGF